MIFKKPKKSKIKVLVKCVLIQGSIILLFVHFFSSYSFVNLLDDLDPMAIT